MAIALPLAAQPPPTDVEKEIEALKVRPAELDRIAKQQKGSSATATVTPAAPAPTSTTPDTNGVQFVRWNEVVAGSSRFKLYGFLRADAIYDDSRPNNTLIPAFIRSENSGGAGFQSLPNSEDFTIHPRLTRFGLDFQRAASRSAVGCENGRQSRDRLLQPDPRRR